VASSTPKDPSQRRGTQKPIRGEWSASPGLGWQHGPTPPCPNGVSADTKTAWKAWFSSFAVSNLSPGDLPGLRVVARLHSAVVGGDYTRAPELRLWLAGYGLSPKGLQDRRWKAPEVPEAAKPAGKSKPASDYAHLNVVVSED
jgi:hypothetical protein